MKHIYRKHPRTNKLIHIEKPKNNLTKINVPKKIKKTKAKKKIKKTNIYTISNPKIDKPRMSIEICALQFRYTKRCWWQLSSLVQQKYTDIIPKITYKLNLHKNDPYHELNKKLIRTFENLVDLKIKYWDNDTFYYRGMSRNADIIEASKEWVLFIDPDMVFSTDFFDKLQSSNAMPSKLNGTGRWSTNIPRAYEIVNSEKYTDHPILDAARRTSNLPIYYRRMAGAGNFQLINKPYLIDNDLTYCIPQSNGLTFDVALNKSNRHTGSDKQLRRTIGINRLKIPPVYHLNHWRPADPLFSATECY